MHLLREDHDSDRELVLLLKRAEARDYEVFEEEDSRKGIP
jgi:hypothetical protein